MSVFDWPERHFTVEQVRDRGREAQRMLQGEVFREALEFAERKFLMEWREGTDVAAREAAWAKLHALEAFQQGLRAIMSDGEQASHVLEHREWAEAQAKKERPI